MNKYQLIIDSQYMANITYYKKIVEARYIIIEQYDEHKKKSFQNRTVIMGANGRITLSIPLLKGRTQKTISKDVRISNAEKWQLQHWRSIISSYNNSPWFKFFSDSLAVIYFRRFGFLMDWNLACLDWTLNYLKLPVEYQLTTEWNQSLPSEVADLRNTIVPAGDTLTNLSYPQVFGNKFGFQPNLSILDLICCEGPKRAALLLERQG